jgi:hypothetical protein
MFLLAYRVVRGMSSALTASLTLKCLGNLGSHLPGALSALHATSARQQAPTIHSGGVGSGQGVIRLLRHEHLYNKPLPFARHSLSYWHGR